MNQFHVPVVFVLNLHFSVYLHIKSMVLQITKVNKVKNGILDVTKKDHSFAVTDLVDQNKVIVKNSKVVKN